MRKRFPHAHIGWLVGDSCAGLLEHHPALDEIIRFDRRRYGQVGRSLRVSLEFAQFVNELRAKRFDLVVDLQGLFRSGFLSLASGAAVRIGFARARELAPLFYTHRIAVQDVNMHAVDRNYRVARMLGFDDVPIAFELPVLPGAARARELLSQEGIRAGDAYILVGPAARWETKIWPAEQFARLTREIQALGYRVVLSGMDHEAARAARVNELASGSLANLAGKTTLPELIALVEGATAVVMHDSGPMHLASALDKPIVALYGPTGAVRTGPYRRGAQAVVRLDLPCSPCYFRKLSQCPHEHRCMRDLTAQWVLERLARRAVLACGGAAMSGVWTAALLLASALASDARVSETEPVLVDAARSARLDDAAGDHARHRPAGPNRAARPRLYPDAGSPGDAGGDHSYILRPGGGPSRRPVHSVPLTCVRRHPPVGLHEFSLSFYAS